MDLTILLGTALAGVVAAVVAYLRGKAKGSRAARTEMELDDATRADDIRRRARDADGLHDDEHGWRD